MNLKGGPAMPLKEYINWHERTVLGASLAVVAPTGQYDAARLINPSIHRWAFKPKLGLSSLAKPLGVGFLRGRMVLHAE